MKMVNIAWVITIAVISASIGVAIGYLGYQAQKGCSTDSSGKTTCSK